MEVSLARKKELEEQDPFLENVNKGIELAKKYKIQIISVVTAIIIAWVSISAYIYYQNTQEKKGLVALQQVNASLNPADTKGNENTKLFETAKKGYQEVINMYGGTMAGKIAMAQLGDLFYGKKEYDKAIELYKKAINGFEGTSLQNLIMSSLAITYEQKKDYDNAEKIFLQIAGSTSNYRKDEAYYHLGILYEKKKDSAKSLAMFEKISKDSFYYQMIQEKLL